MLFRSNIFEYATIFGKIYESGPHKAHDLQAGKTVHTGISPVGTLVTIVRQAVGQYHVTGPQHRIVPDGLRQHLTVYSDPGSLALDEHQRTGPVVHDHHIGTLRRSVHRYGILLDDPHGLCSAMGNQKPDQVTAHPLLGSQHQVDSPKRIPNGHLLPTLRNPQFDGRKIEPGIVGNHIRKKLEAERFLVNLLILNNLNLKLGNQFLKNLLALLNLKLLMFFQMMNLNVVK